MSSSTSIGWTDATWPIVAGCEYESPGCSNCWAVRDSWRLMHSPHLGVAKAFNGVVEKKLGIGTKLVWTGVVRPIPSRLFWPLKWRKPRRIFVCSQSDLFHPKVPFEFIAAVFGIGAMRPDHTLQVLTKHPRRALEFFAWLEPQPGGPLATCLWFARCTIGPELANRFDPYPDRLPEWPLENVWFGVTVEDRARALERIPVLRQIPARIRWLSVEPMLEEITLATATGGASLQSHFDWVVCGGESAQTRTTTRPFDIAWARALRDECKSADVAFFMKQLGSRASQRMDVRGDGVEVTVPFLPPAGKNARYKFHESANWPEDLRVQEFPDERVAA